jgi:hypothetical protein
MGGSPATMELTTRGLWFMDFEWFPRPPKCCGKMMGVDPSGSGRLAQKLPSNLW